MTVRHESPVFQVGQSELLFAIRFELRARNRPHRGKPTGCTTGCGSLDKRHTASAAERVIPSRVGIMCLQGNHKSPSCPDREVYFRRDCRRTSTRSSRERKTGKNPAEQISKTHKHPKILTECALCRQFLKLLILQMYGVMASDTTGIEGQARPPRQVRPVIRKSPPQQRRLGRGTRLQNHEQTLTGPPIKGAGCQRRLPLSPARERVFSVDFFLENPPQHP